jgi:histidinol-phosphate aminotransferase
MNDRLANLIATRIRQDVQSMHAYAIQDARGLVKLDAMENPHRLPPELRRALGERLAEVELNRYPGDRVNDLRRALAAHAALPEGFDLMLGNGSDELISLLAMACDVPGASILAPLPGFVMYGMSAQLQGLKFIGVDLTPDFELDERAMLAAIERHQPSIVYLAYPNNPTANLWDDAVIEKIIEAAPGLVVIDEAYQPFSSRSYIDRLPRHRHVLLMRTLSKFGLAGVRIGYLMGQ